MKLPFICGNWKMYKTVADAVKYTKEFRVMVKDISDVEIVVAPTFTALHAAAEAARNSNIVIAAQDLYWEREGAFTGEISPAMLAELGCRWVLLGHSERRHVFRETDEEINRKMTAALRHGIAPVLCVGETEEERRQGLTFTVVEGQLRAAWAGLSSEDLARCVLAYEPVWAIGTGAVATPAQAAEVHRYLRGLVSEVASKELAQSVRILYGGSVKADNAQALTQEPDIDGVLVGGASLQASSFITIAKKSAARSGASKG